MAKHVGKKQPTQMDIARVFGYTGPQLQNRLNDLSKVGHIFMRQAPRAQRPLKLPEKITEAFLRKHTRIADRNPKLWPTWGTDLPTVQEQLGFPILNKIAEEVIGEYGSNKIDKFTRSNPFRVLEIGCGPGYALAELKTPFYGRVHTTGIVLRKQKEKPAGVDDYQGVDFFKYTPDKKFGFIKS